MKIIQPRFAMWTTCPGYAEPVKCKYGETDTWEGTHYASYLSFSHVPLTGPGGGLCLTKFEVTVFYSGFGYEETAHGKTKAFYVAEQ